MTHQIVYVDTPQEQIYTQNPNLVQYNIETNQQALLGVGDVQYNFINLPAQNTNNQSAYININYDPTQLYQQNIQQPVNQQYIYQQQINQNVQQVHPQYIDNSKQYQIQNQIQPQAIPQENYYHHHNEPKAQINPQLQIPNIQAQQKQIPNIKAQQKQIHNVQTQQKLRTQVQAKNHLQGQSGGYSPADLKYMKYVQKYQNQNINKKMNIVYNKKDEHFVNRPIYEKKKLSAQKVNNKDKSKDKNKNDPFPKNIKTFNDTKTLIQGTKIINLNMKSNLKGQKNELFNNLKKHVNSDLPPISE